MAQFEIHSLGRAKLAGKCNAYIVRATVFNNMNLISTKTLVEFTARAKGIREIQNTQITDASRAGALTGSHSRMTLNSTAAARWNTFLRSKTQAVISKTAPALKIRIPLKKFTQSVKKTGGKRNKCKHIIYYNYLHL